ncbi:MAG: sensor histidine kinase [Cyanobacteria bacterium J06648_16]
MPRLLTLPRILLILELMLLGVAIFLASIAWVIDVFPQLPVLTIVCVGVIALLGLKPINNKRFYAVGYTLVEFGLIGLPVLVGKSIVTFPILGAVLVLRSAQRFSLLGRLGVAVGVYALFIFNLFILNTTFINPLNLWLGSPVLPTDTNLLFFKLCSIIYYGMILAFVWLFVNALVSENQGRERLAVTLSQLRDYSLRVEDQAALQERNRIAREIHDALGHTLTAQSVQLDSGLHLLDTNQIGQADVFFKRAKSLCAQALQEVRQSVSVLRRDCLAGQSLEEAIAALVGEFKATSTITIDWSIDVPRSLPSELNSTLYRIIQAALTNIIRHSSATEATLQITTHSQTLYLVIKDNGRGFKPTQNSTGFGLQGMQERTLALSGRFHIFSEPGAGCLITVQIPLPSPLL